jgi:chitodextrinase
LRQPAAGASATSDAPDESPFSVTVLNTSQDEYLPYTSGQFTTAAVSISGPDGLTTTAVTQTAATIGWNAASDNAYPITGYDVQYRQDGSSSWISAGMSSRPGTTLAGLTPATSYDVEVDAVDSAGNVGSWSVAANLFTTASLPGPMLIAPADGAIGQSTTPTFSWTAVSGVVGGYNLIVDTSPTDLPTNPAGAAGPTTVFSDHVTGTSDTITSALHAGTIYYWEVQGIGSGGTAGGWSRPGSFTPGQLTVPTLTTPALQGTGVSATPVFGWNGVTGAADGYNIIVDTSASDLPTSPSGTAGSSAVFSAQTNATSDTLISALQPNTTYYWQVQAVASGGVQGAWSSAGSFTTIGPGITVLSSGQVIEPGQGISSPADSIDFGSVVRGHAATAETFTIENTGNTIVTMGRLQVPKGFTVLSEPPRSLAPGHVATFKVRLNSTTLGTFGGVVSFVDKGATAEENPFTFAITGRVISPPAPAMNVLFDGQTIEPGRIPPSMADGTDLGSVDLGSAQVPQTFTIQNTGNAVLTLGRVTVPHGFVVVTEPPKSLAPGASATFTIALNPAKAGAFHGFVSFADNDPRPGQRPFRFAITGMVVAGAPGTG